MKLMKSLIAGMLLVAMLVLCAPVAFAGGPADAITEASIALGTDITLNVYATTAKTDTPKMAFTLGANAPVTVDGEATGNSCEFLFKFRNIGPQNLTDNVKMVLLNGETELAVKDGFTVADYCYEVIAQTKVTVPTNTNNSDNTSLFTAVKQKTLIADLLDYANAAQVFTSHNTENLAKKTKVNGSDFTAPASSDNNAQNGSAVSFVSANLWFENTVRIRFTFTAASLDNLVMKIGGTAVSPIEIEAGKYYVETADINATDFDKVFTCVAEVGGVQDAAATYSVKSYVYSKNADANTALANLVKALYKYGKSAEKYVQNATVSSRGGFGSMNFTYGVADTYLVNGQLKRTTSFIKTYSQENGGADGSKADTTLKFASSSSASYPEYVNIEAGPTDPANKALHMKKSVGWGNSEYSANSMHVKFTSNSSIASPDSQLVFRFSVYVDEAGMGVDNSFNSFAQMLFRSKDDTGANTFFAMYLMENTTKAATPATGFTVRIAKNTNGGYQEDASKVFELDKWHTFTLAFRIDVTGATPVFKGVSIYVNGEWLCDSMAYYCNDNAKTTAANQGTFVYNSLASGSQVSMSIQSPKRATYDYYLDNIYFYEQKVTFN